LRQHLKGLAHVAKLTEMRDEIRSLREKVAILEESQRKARPEA